MALDPSTRIRIEKLILKQLGDRSEPFRRLNMSFVANETGVDQKTVGLVVAGLIDHGKIEMSPVRRYWYRRTEADQSNPSDEAFDDLLARQSELEDRIARLEARLAQISNTPPLRQHSA